MQDMNKYIAETPTMIEKYEQVFLDPIREHARETGQTIVYVDISITGRSVELFDAIMRRNVPELKKAELLMLTDTLSQVPQIPREVLVRKSLYTKKGYELVQGYFARLTPQFPRTRWFCSDPAIMRVYPNIPSAARNIKLIEDFIETHGGVEVYQDFSPLVNVQEFFTLKGTKLHYNELQQQFTLPLSHWTNIIKSDIEIISESEVIARHASVYDTGVEEEAITTPRDSPISIALELDNIHALRYEILDGKTLLFSWAKRIVSIMNSDIYVRDQIGPSFVDLLTKLPTSLGAEIDISNRIGFREFAINNREWLQSAIPRREDRLALFLGEEQPVESSF